MNPYETDRLLAEYLLFHYGSADDLLGNLPGPVAAVGFATRLVEALLDHSRLGPASRALDVGCAVGGSTFALSAHCAQVLGVDFSHRFIEAATVLARDGRLTIEVIEEGLRTRPFTATVPASSRPEVVKFAVADALNLPTAWPPFDVVLAANVLCRLPRPRVFLRRLPGLVQPGGQLLLTTPFTWMEEFTPVAEWIGGTPETGASWASLQAILQPDFSLEHTVEIPLLLREHARKFQYTVALGSRWRRRAA